MTCYQLRPSRPDDYKFVLDLMHDNMVKYYKRHRLQFSDHAFKSNYDESDNYIIEESGSFLGALRVIEKAPDFLHISDIQIVQKYQNIGIGSWAMGLVHSWAKTRNLNQVHLNVFTDTRLGYKLSEETSDYAIRHMTRDVLETD